ncbi:MAG: hypothetical protein ABI547_03445 [Betaproteobacteria bacterium]
MPLKLAYRTPQQAARIAACVLLATAGYAQHAAAQLHAKPITDPATVYELEGYSVTPPPGKGWFEMQHDRQQVLFGKKVDSPTHSFGATATSDLIGVKFETREQFQEYVNKLRTAEFDPARFKVIEFESSMDTTGPAWCVRYRLKHTDRNAVLARNRTLLVEDIGVTCLHPDKRELVVDVGYSERGRAAELKSELSSGLRTEGESFMSSLKFKGR